jgi:3-oxoadipate enol-lactonase
MIRDMRPADESAPTRHRDLYIEVNDARLRYRDEGQGPAVIFVHGWALDLDMWAPQAAALAATYRVIRFDRRGFGSSSGHPSLVQDVADLQAMCRSLNLRRAAFVGMSQGARITLQLTSMCPALVSCLVLDGPPSIAATQGANDSQELPYQDFRLLAQSHGVPAFRKVWMEHPLARVRTDDPHAHELLARMIARYPGRDLVDRARHPAFVTTKQMIETILTPVLVISGELDLDSRKRFADELLCRLPRSRHAAIPRAGHLCNLDNPQAYTAALRQFLDRHATSSDHH